MDLTEALAEAKAARILAEKAMHLAQEALIEVKAMKASTHKIEYVNPYNDILGGEESTAVPGTGPKTTPSQLSPFNLGASAKEILNNNLDVDQDLEDDSVGVME